ncbi:MAG: tetratricopeptide repeat protein [Deltaproteobacteria bacterium]|nr:tetratricopeptide repeat protein [Deltaproteobacteria bacterium]
MSRSEHATRRDRRDPGDLARKRRIKAQVEQVRQRPREALPPVDVHGVPIAIRDTGPFIHYPAADDLRAVLARLPPGAVDGIAGIELRLPAADTDVDEGELDPYLGLLRSEAVPGVFGGRVIGTYDRDTAIISLHAYVYDPGLRDRGIVELWLRLRMLATLMHELGHHEEWIAVGERARWRKDGLIASEAHAETIEYAWTRDVVVPYLEEVAAAEVAALRAWLEHHGGIAVPLEMLVDDPRRSAPVAPSEALWFGPEGAFCNLLRDVWSGAEPLAAQVEFATQLHYGLNYDEALEILARVLAREPDHVEALLLRADIFVHQDRIDEADAIAQALRAREPGSDQLWDVIVDVARARGDWPALEAAAAELIRRYAGSYALSRARAQRIAARIELGDWAGAEADLAAMEREARNDRQRAHVRVWRCVLTVRRGDFAAGLPLARALLAERRPGLLARAAFADAAGALGVACDDDVVEELRAAGHRAWADLIASR